MVRKNVYDNAVKQCILGNPLLSFVPCKKISTPVGVLIFFYLLSAEDLHQLPSVGMSPSGLITRGEASLPPPVADKGSEDSA